MADLLETTEIINEDIGATSLPIEASPNELKRCGEFICPSQGMLALHPGFYVAPILVIGIYGLSANCISIYMYFTITKYPGGNYTS